MRHVVWVLCKVVLEILKRHDDYLLLSDDANELRNFVYLYEDTKDN